MARKGPPIIMVSSSVYGFEQTLDQIDAVLRGFGYRVWMSHNNSLPVNSKFSNFENCLRAVKRCDAFLGIIRGQYGSGRVSRIRSITHRELLKAIDLNKRFPQTRIRAIRYSGAGRENLADNRVFEGNAFTLLKKATSFLEAHIPVQSAIPTGELRRKEAPAVPFPAVREALLNAVAHRDYAAPDGGISVSVYADRVEIWNSGLLPEGISPSDLKTMSVSRPHNPDMAHVLLIRGYMERVGSGIQRILAAFKQAKLPEPEWKEMGEGIAVILRWQKSGVEINERQKRLLETLRPGEATNMAKYRKEFAKDVKERQARTDLKELVDLGYLWVRGKGRSTEYVRAERELP